MVEQNSNNKRNQDMYLNISVYAVGVKNNCIIVNVKQRCSLVLTLYSRLTSFLKAKEI